MNTERLIKYSLPFFVFAIASGTVEEISFIYYAVPVMCILFIGLLFVGLRFERNKHKGDPSTPLRMTKPSEDTSTHSANSGQASRSVTDSRRTSFAGMTDSEQVGMTGSKIGIKHFPSSIFHLPFAICLIPGLWFLLTSIWSSYPDVSAARALYFILISLGCISAGILWLRYSEKNIFDFLLPANVIAVVICLFSILTNIPSDSWTGGHGKGFMGFFGHQNLLASVLLFTLPAVLSKFQRPVNSNQLLVNSNTANTKILPTTNYLLLTSNYLPVTAYSLLLTANLLLLTLTYSRSAILSLIFGVIVFLIMNKNWKLLVYSFVFVSLVSIIIYSNPSFNQFADKIIKKDFPEFYSSRMWMWEPSYQAAVNGGFTGLGYGISDPDIKPGSLGDHYEGERFIREKGNSVLALIEESGLIGLFLFLLPIIYLLAKARDTRFQIPDEKKLSGTRLPVGKVRHPESIIQKLATSILIASLAAFILHAQFEAWWVGVGSVQLPLFFIYTGLLNGSYLSNIKRTLSNLSLKKRETYYQ